MQNERKAFITTDIVVKEYEYENIERYELSHLTIEEIKENDYAVEVIEKEAGKKIAELSNEEIEEHAQNVLDYETYYDVPMMNSLYYFPAFCEFDLQEARAKCSGATTLIYDSELEQYAVAMSGGGMDLSPHLLDTFIGLASGVPENIAMAVSKDYNAYVNAERHTENLELLAKALIEQGERYKQRAKELTSKEK